MCVREREREREGNNILCAVVVGNGKNLKCFGVFIIYNNTYL